MINTSKLTVSNNYADILNNNNKIDCQQYVKEPAKLCLEFELSKIPSRLNKIFTGYKSDVLMT